MFIRDHIHAGVSYLLTQTRNGICSEYAQLRHGESIAWTTACVGSTLSEFIPPAKLADIREALLAMQWDNGGWSYNHNVLPDADTTLRVMQFLQKIAWTDKKVMTSAEQFVIAHQGADGGIATYLPETVAHMGYTPGGWTMSHPCVSVLACNVLRESHARKRCVAYVQGLQDTQAYWWQTNWYVLYEMGVYHNIPVSEDPVELALALLTESKRGMGDAHRVNALVDMQEADGRFPSSHQFRIPRPHQQLSDLQGTEEAVADLKGILSTCAAIVALSRQQVLLK